RFEGLLCGTSYGLGVDAVDRAENRSGIASVTGRTDACPDTTPPTPPERVRVTAATANSVTVEWDQSSDDVGVDGYGVYRDVTRVADTSSTSFTVDGLSCGTEYKLAVDAYDAAGNRSRPSVLTAKT